MPRVLRSFATTCCYVNKYDIDSFKKFLDVKLVRDIFLFKNGRLLYESKICINISNIYQYQKICLVDVFVLVFAQVRYTA